MYDYKKINTGTAANRRLGVAIVKPASIAKPKRVPRAESACINVVQLGAYPPPHGGVQTNVAAICNFLRKRQIMCTVINLTRFRGAAAEGVYFPKNAIQVLRLLFRLPSDVVHLHIGGNVSSRLLALSLICCLLPRRKAVLTIHSGGYPSSTAGKTARRWSLPGFVFRQFDGVIAVNLEIVRSLQKLGVPSSRIHLICPYAPSEAEVALSLPAHLERFFQGHKPKLITVGSLDPEYDFALQIEALGPIREKFPDAGLLIVGRAGSVADALRKQIAAKNYGQHVLLCGDLPHAAVLRAIRESDVFLRTTLYDGDSISVREALSLNIPVIATDNGMRPEGVDLIPTSNADALVESVTAILSQRKKRPVGEAADIGKENMEAVLSLYQQLTQKKKERTIALSAFS